MSERLTKTCEHCGNEFHPLKGRVVRFARQKFCSAECHQLSRRMAPVPKNCAVCGVGLKRGKTESFTQWTRRQTCSRACATIRQRHNSPPCEDKACVHCGKMFGIRDGEKAYNFRKRRTCSAKCASARSPIKAAEASIAVRTSRMSKSAAEQLAIDERCKENIRNYWERLGVKVDVRLVPHDRDVWLVRSNIVRGVPL